MERSVLKGILIAMFSSAFLLGSPVLAQGETAAAEKTSGMNLLSDPSFELTRPRNQFGMVFEKWGGWKYEGDCSFEVGLVAHSGKTSCLLKGGPDAKIRVRQDIELAPGRYRITAYIRGLGIGEGRYRNTTEFAFNDKYMQLAKNGTFGWSKLTYVGELKEKKKAAPSFGMMAPGYLWIDDVMLEKVDDSVELTEKPVIDKEEAPIAAPGKIVSGYLSCAECGYRNMPSWKACYACGTPLPEIKISTASLPAVMIIDSFEGKSSFSGGKAVEEHATDGRKALKLESKAAVTDAKMDWSGYDYLKADCFTESAEPLKLYVEIRDNQTKDYWTRVNYETVVLPGKSTLVLPVKQLYVGEKSRPGHPLILNGVTRLVFSIGEKPAAPLFLDNIRLERDDSLKNVLFDGLNAFDLGNNTSPVMPGFTRVTPSSVYNKERGFGFQNARIWKAFDVLQPDPLYQDFICILGGGFAVDLPDGRYHVFMNIDNPSGYWGEYQTYTSRKVLAQGKEVSTDTMDLTSFRNKYFRFWDTEDLPDQDTFDKYQKAYYKEKEFDVDVKGGQLKLDFQGEGFAVSLSCLIIYPLEKAAEGKKFLAWVENQRRFFFDNYFKRVLHTPTGDPVKPAAEDNMRGYVAFTRDIMKDVYYNDTPFKDEIKKPLAADVFAGEVADLSAALRPLKDLGVVTAAAGDLTGPGGVIPAATIEIGYVSYRVTRMTMEGSICSLTPRYVMPKNSVNMPCNVTREFWIKVKTPPDCKPGVYNGAISFKAEKGGETSIPVELRVRGGTLDALDTPAGPIGGRISLPFKDPAAREWEELMYLKSLKKMREYGFTCLTGLPWIEYKGFNEGKPVLDFTAADKWMKNAKELGFLAVQTYGGGVQGFSAYYQDTDKMKAAGFTDYAEFLKAVYTEVQKHADELGWLTVYYNLGDENTSQKSVDNAEAYRKAFPKGPPYFTALYSFKGTNKEDLAFKWSKALHVAGWNLHDEDGVNLLRSEGGEWAFYNGGDRWTYGDYLYKAVKQFGLKYRVSWHWNIAAGDPYYALDCREDDYAWCNSSPYGDLLPDINLMERKSLGLGDFRRLLTLSRLCKEKAGTPAAISGEKLIADRMASFKLGDREHDKILGFDDWNSFRAKINEAIEGVNK